MVLCKGKPCQYCPPTKFCNSYNYSYQHKKTYSYVKGVFVCPSDENGILPSRNIGMKCCVLYCV